MSCTVRNIIVLFGAWVLALAGFSFRPKDCGRVADARILRRRRNFWVQPLYSSGRYTDGYRPLRPLKGKPCLGGAAALQEPPPSWGPVLTMASSAICTCILRMVGTGQTMTNCVESMVWVTMTRSRANDGDGRITSEWPL